LIERNVCWAEESILQHARLTADQARAMRTDLRRLGPMPKMVDRIDIGERYMFLDSAAILDREGVGQLVRVTRLADLNGKTDGAIETIVSWAGRVIIDWDQVLRTGNSWYDRMVDARGKSTPPQRKVAMDKIAADLEQQTDRIRDPKSLAFDLIGNPCETVSKSMVVILLAAELPMIATTADAEDCAAMRSEITDLGFALAAYRADHDAYPARLDDLVPAYVAEVPRDIFADASLRYKRRPGGYLLYSVGINGKDDGGRGYEDRGELDDWDDVAIRVPARKRKGG